MDELTGLVVAVRAVKANAAGETRTGATYCALRLRAHGDEAVVGEAGVVPGLVSLPGATLVDDAPPHELYNEPEEGPR